MDDLLCGDPAVRPITVAASMQTEKNNNDTGKSSDLPPLKLPKRRIVQEKPARVAEYRAELRAKHTERMALKQVSLLLIRF